MSPSLAATAGGQPADQATRLRRLAEALRSQPAPERAPRAGSPEVGVPPSAGPVRLPAIPMLAVASGKGGVGKTFLSVNLCIALVQRGVRPVLLDADAGLANADVLCGLAPARRLDRVFTSGTARLDDLLVEGPGGFGLVPGSVGALAEGRAARRRLLERLCDVEPHADLLVIDTSAGLAREVADLALAAGEALIVATPEPTSIADAYAMIKVLHAARPAFPTEPSRGLRLQLVVNAAADEGEAHRIHARIGAVADRFLQRRVPLAGWIPRDPAAPRSICRRCPLMVSSPEAPAATAIARLAAAVTTTLCP